MKSYDVIVYGATGFTGRQAAAYLAAHPDARELRIAIAGRRRDALEELARSLPRAPGVIVADSSDPPSVDAMVQMGRVLLTTAGPYARYGDPVVDACVAHGVDYVDITGETPWVRRVIDRHHDTASASGVRIVPLCGFDSVPSDLGVWLAVDHIRRELGEDTREVKGFFRAKGGLNGGTLASALALGESGDGRALADPLLLNPKSHRSRDARRLNPDQRGPRFETDLDRWTAPFVMAAVNSRVVQRSNALADLLDGEPYGAPFTYRESMLMGRSRGRLRATLTSLGLRVADRALAFAPARRLLARLGPSPGEGPTEEVRTSGFYRARFVARSRSGVRVDTIVSDQGDPGNTATVKMLCESALCLALSRDALPGSPSRGGVLTPATAFGQVLVDRLRATGTRLEVIPAESPA